MSEPALLRVNAGLYQLTPSPPPAAATLLLSFNVLPNMINHEL